MISLLGETHDFFCTIQHRKYNLNKLKSSWLWRCWTLQQILLTWTRVFSVEGGGSNPPPELDGEAYLVIIFTADLSFFARMTSTKLWIHSDRLIKYELKIWWNRIGKQRMGRRRRRKERGKKLGGTKIEFQIKFWLRNLTSLLYNTLETLPIQSQKL